MICEYCDNPVPAGVTRCPSCGAAVAAPISPASQTTVAPIVQQVPVVVSVPYVKNAVQQSEHNLQQVQRKSRTIYIVLGWFLGFLGIHNFYAGRKECAIAQLVISVLFCWLIVPLIAVGIWVLIELCIVKTDGHGFPMTD